MGVVILPTGFTVFVLLGLGVRSALGHDFAAAQRAIVALAVVGAVNLIGGAIGVFLVGLLSGPNVVPAPTSSAARFLSAVIAYVNGLLAATISVLLGAQQMLFGTIVGEPGTALLVGSLVAGVVLASACAWSVHRA